MSFNNIEDFRRLEFKDDETPLDQRHLNSIVNEIKVHRHDVANINGLREVPVSQLLVNADWNAVSGHAQILNKPVIPSNFDSMYPRMNAAQNISGANAGTLLNNMMSNIPTGITPEAQERFRNAIGAGLGGADAGCNGGGIRQYSHKCWPDGILLENFIPDSQFGIFLLTFTVGGDGSGGGMPAVTASAIVDTGANRSFEIPVGWNITTSMGSFLGGFTLHYGGPGSMLQFTGIVQQVPNSGGWMHIPPPNIVVCESICVLAEYST